jgi:hypothetical protein
MFYSVLGDWEAIASNQAPSRPYVFRQAAAMKNDDAPRVIVGSLVFSSFVARVSCRPVSGETARGCGLVVRAQGVDDYDVARWDELHETLELARVNEGREEVLASTKGPQANGGWHTITVSAHLRVVTVTLDETVSIEAKESSLSEGKIGLWTHADAVSDFDDLEIAAE